MYIVMYDINLQILKTSETETRYGQKLCNQIPQHQTSENQTKKGIVKVDPQSL